MDARTFFRHGLALDPTQRRFSRKREPVQDGLCGGEFPGKEASVISGSEEIRITQPGDQVLSISSPQTGGCDFPRQSLLEWITTKPGSQNSFGLFLHRKNFL